VTDCSGCGLVELAVLRAVGEFRGGRRRVRAVRSMKVLAELDRRIGLGPSYAYRMVCDLATPWVIPVTLLAMPAMPWDRESTEPGSAAHTACRLSRVGELVLAAEAGEIAPVPTGLINGTWWRGAAQPPLDPLRVIEALRALIGDPGLPDGRLLDLAGLPVSLTGSDLTGDFGVLAQGRRTTIREAARMARTGVAVPPVSAEPARRPRAAGPFIFTDDTGRPPRPVHLIIGAVPRHASIGDLGFELSQHIRAAGWQPPGPPAGLRQPEEARQQMAARWLPIASMSTEGTENNRRLEITLQSGADPQAVQAQIARLPAFAMDRISRFPAPLTDLLRSWVTTRRRKDITASLSQLEAAVHADRLDQQAFSNDT